MRWMVCSSRTPHAMPHHHSHHHRSKAETESTEELDTLTADLSLKVSSTTSSTSSTSSSRTSLSSLTHSLLPHKHHTSHKLAKHPALSFVEPETPAALVHLAMECLLTIPGPPLEDLRVIMGKLYHTAYSHRVNCREMGLEGLFDLIQHFRGRFRVLKVRFKQTMMDQDGTA
jgi:hypothetical protein